MILVFAIAHYTDWRFFQLLRMKQENWKNVREIFVEALGQEPAAREEFLDHACKGDGVRREVESLLSSYNSAESFMEKPAVLEVSGFSEKPQLETGQILKHYKIISQIGLGGMGEVYLAQDTKLKRKVALKILSNKFSVEPQANERLLREARAAATLEHPNICTIHEIGETSDFSFIVMQYVEGETLSEKIAKNTLTIEKSINLAIRIADALEEAHTSGIIHRDIKPANIIVSKKGQVKVLDFGLAKVVESRSEDETLKMLSHPNAIMGTTPYMSPEQLQGKPLDSRADIFSFGVMFYEMLSGKQPFNKEDGAQTIAAILKTEPEPLSDLAPNTPTGAEQIIARCLQKEREERYQTTKDLLDDLIDLRNEYEFDGKSSRSAPQTGYQDVQTDKTRTTTSPQVVQNSSSAEYITTEIRRHKYVALAGLTALVIALAAFGYYAYFAPEPSITSIAVLPFENGNDDENLAYLSDGLSEDLINRLSQLPQLKVISRQSSFKFKSKDANFREIGNKLDVQAVVAGKILKVGDRLTIRVEMVDTSDNKQIWGERYVKTVDDVLVIQNEIARIVSEKLHLQLTGQQKQKIAEVGTVNVEAYESYLSGRIIASKGGPSSPNEAIKYYEKSIELDPDFALSYVGLAGVYLGKSWLSEMDPQDAMSQIKKLVEKALELDPNLAEAYLILANIKMREWDFDGAKRRFEKAIELAPNSAKIRTSYGQFLSYMGEHDKALFEIKNAQILDPLATFAFGEAYFLLEAQRFEEAIEKIKYHIKLNPGTPLGSMLYGYALAGNGNYKEAIESYKKAIELSYKPNEIGSHHIYLGAAYALDGNREEALKILKKLEEKDRTKDGYISYTEFSIIYGALGDNDKAFWMLEKAYERKDFQLITLYADPAYEPLRDDPRFKDLARRVGLPQQD